MRAISNRLRLWTTVSVVLLAGNSTLLARSWSYHYHPEAQQPTAIVTPAAVTSGATEGLAQARLLKLAIVSDLAIYAQDQGPRSSTAFGEHMQYVAGKLSRFDAMNSPDALKVFASLSGYYLGAPAERLYHCLVLRKGKPLEPYLEEHLHAAGNECQTDLGPGFTKPSAALDGFAVCRSPSQQRDSVRALIAAIDSGASCSDSELTALVGNTAG